MRPIRTLALLALAALASGCGPRATMTAIPPPRSWSEELAADRRARDDAFRTDPDSPLPEAARAGFRGLDYFPPDPSWRYAGFIEWYDAPQRFTIVTTTGTPRPCERVGKVTFERDGRTLALQVYRLLDLPSRGGGEGLFLPFKDQTTGRETYAAGRYVDLEGPDGGPFTLDFNRAYDPSCAYGDPSRFQCPATPPENTLPIAVTAGERGPARHGAAAAP